MRLARILTEALEAPDLPSKDQWGSDDFLFHHAMANDSLDRAATIDSADLKGIAIRAARRHGTSANDHAQAPQQRNQIIVLFKRIREAERDFEANKVRTGEARSELEQRLSEALSQSHQQ